MEPRASRSAPGATAAASDVAFDLTRFDPLVQEWFAARFEGATAPQLAGWHHIAAGRDVLISVPTGSGKTLAAFLIALDRLVSAARAGSLADELQVIYVSPLKALSNDVRKNLETPLAEIAALAQAKGISLAPIRTAVRTGDTPAHERQQMTRRAPHILVTTPESLFILATAERSRKMLATASVLIVDEIHAVVGDKRGSHLALTLARIDALCAAHGSKPQRIGLSATVRPIEEVAEYLAPGSAIVNIGHRREMDLAIEVPDDELGAVATAEMWDEIYDRVARHIALNRTTLVFVNTRRLAERVARALAERLGEAAVLPHHGSLSRELRFSAEQRLKAGELKAVVATASLELGIDIGTVDLAIQIGTTRSIAVALQRIGRSGHWVGARPSGILFPTTRDELIECAALVQAIRAGDLERVRMPQNALDILAQQLIAEAAAAQWPLDALYALVRSAYPYRTLERATFDAIIHMASDGIATSRGRSGALLHLDQVNAMVRGRRGARLAAITSGGAIPDNANFTVLAEPEGTVIGTLDEDFAIESMTGDVFLLGTHSWRIRHVTQGRVYVNDAQGAPPSIPFWLGEAPGRSAELSQAVSRLRERITAPDAAAWLQAECGLDAGGTAQAIAYVHQGLATLGALPTTNTIVAERFFDESGGMQLIIHAPFGSRVNRAWGLALRKRFCRTFNFELQAAATDNGIVISLSDRHAFPLEVIFEFLKPATVEDVLTQALLAAPMCGVRWRWNASRALAIPRFSGGKRTPPNIQRMRAEDLLAAVFPDQVACAENLSGPIRVPEHPLVAETIANCLHEAMDLETLEGILRGIASGDIRTVALDTPSPSVFCHEILNANPYAFLDDAPLEERRARAVQLRATLPGTEAGPDAVLDPEAIAQVAAESWPDVRDADELHDALLTLITLPPQPEWAAFYATLATSGRARLIHRSGEPFWVATERLALADDVLATLRGWMECSGPLTVPALAQRLAFPETDINEALHRLEAEGQVMRGHFDTRAALSRASSPQATAETGATQWCNRRVLARIHRTTLARLRREIEPATAAELYRFLLKWQHMAPGTQLHGADGLFEVIGQLQGYEVPAAAWESQIFPARIAAYSPEMLDELCLSGDVTWARISPHPALEDGSGKRIRATRLAPIAMMLRADAEWLTGGEGQPGDALSLAARATFDVLTSERALFFNDIVRLTRHLPSEIEDALWELVAAGLVTADGFENLRAILDPKRRSGQGRARHSRPRHAAGRWALVSRAAESHTAEHRAQVADRWADQLLRRWGVLVRDVLARESGAPPWRELLPVLRRKEAQGLIRGGRFLAGFTGEQFARPEALDLLRATRRQPTDAPAIAVALSDPLNLTGILLPGPRVSRLSAIIPTAAATPLAG